MGNGPKHKLVANVRTMPLNKVPLFIGNIKKVEVVKTKVNRRNGRALLRKPRMIYNWMLLTPLTLLNRIRLYWKPLLLFWKVILRLRCRISWYRIPFLFRTLILVVIVLVLRQIINRPFQVINRKVAIRQRHRFLNCNVRSWSGKRTLLLFVFVLRPLLLRVKRWKFTRKKAKLHRMNLLKMRTHARTTSSRISRLGRMVLIFVMSRLPLLVINGPRRVTLIRMRLRKSRIVIGRSLRFLFLAIRIIRTLKNNWKRKYCKRKLISSRPRSRWKRLL